MRRPRRLEDRLVAAAGERPDPRQGAVARPLGDAELDTIPRHVGVIPLRPDQRAAVRADPRIGIEVVPSGEDPRRAGAIGGERDQLVDHLAVGGVALADADERAAVGRELRIGVAQPGRDLRLRRDRARRPAAILAVQPLVDEVAEEDRVAGDQVRRTAVLVDAGADVHVARGDVLGRSGRRPADEHVAAALGGAGLERVQIVSDERDRAQPDGARRDQLRGDRG